MEINNNHQINSQGMYEDSKKVFSGGYDNSNSSPMKIIKPVPKPQPIQNLPKIKNLGNKIDTFA